MKGFIWLDSPLDSILWTFRSWWAGYPVPPYSFNTWTYTNEEDHEIFRRDVGIAMHAWDFLSPFFASRGYSLYTSRFKDRYALFPDPAGPKSHPSPQHPFARREFEHDLQICLSIGSLRVWPARDTLGRDVIIKLVSGHTPSKELMILQRLNTPMARADSRNHTIHVLEYISFGDLVFVIMPRWPPAFGHDFGSVTEIFDCLEQILEAVEFLHENRIAHCDFISQNVGANVIANEDASFLTGMREPGIVKYAVYDFGHSEIFPLDTDIQTAESHLVYSDDEPGITHGKIRPFKDDILDVGKTMERYVRHLENIIPELGPFFDAMGNGDETKRPTAQEALEQCRLIRSNLDDTQIASEVTGRFWDSRIKGNILTKLRRPTERHDVVYELRDT